MPVRLRFLGNGFTALFPQVGPFPGVATAPRQASGPLEGVRGVNLAGNEVDPAGLTQVRRAAGSVSIFNEISRFTSMAYLAIFC